MYEMEAVGMGEKRCPIDPTDSLLADLAWNGAIGTPT